MGKQLLILLLYTETYSFSSDINMWQLLDNALCSYGWWSILRILVGCTVTNGNSCAHHSVICIRRKRWRKLCKKNSKHITIPETGVLNAGVHAHCSDVYLLHTFSGLSIQRLEWDSKRVVDDTDHVLVRAIWLCPPSILVPMLGDKHLVGITHSFLGCLQRQSCGTKNCRHCWDINVRI